jgi:SPX domain protein involved in polyphosphate accumulation
MVSFGRLEKTIDIHDEKREPLRCISLEYYGGDRLAYAFFFLHTPLIVPSILFYYSINTLLLYSVDLGNRQVSLTTPPQTNAQGLAQSSSGVTEEAFLKLLDTEMAKVEKFTLKKVTELRTKLAAAEEALRLNRPDTLQLTDEIAEHFLQLEKYVNINFMGFHKILKKHDKWLPNNPCKVFYVNRMHAQAWVRGDYSDVVVRMSQIYAALRQDQVVKESDDAAQSFLRSTTKYWVKTEDVSRVKYAILRHLPVFLQKTSTGESDSQFTNSVYLDNDQLELYHGRLDKTPGAIALRLRWYGVGDPKLVFVERKTHNEKWTGEVSVKERFMVRDGVCV